MNHDSELREGFAPSQGSEASGQNETVSVGEAAKLLRLSVSQTQRMCEAFARDPSQGLAFVWTGPAARTRDALGRELRGRRRVVRAAVEAEVEARRRRQVKEIPARVESLARRVDRVAAAGGPDLAHEWAAAKNAGDRAVEALDHLVAALKEAEAAVAERRRRTP